MKQIQLVLLFILYSFSVSSQTIEDLSFGTDETLEIVTWNIEWFPKNGQVTKDYVSRIIKALDVDILAIQEVDDVNDFNQMLDDLPGYEGYLESTRFRGLAFIYKKEVVQINTIYEIYNTSGDWNTFPRAPMVMDMTFKNERFIIINNHFKCCGDGILEATNQNDEEARRNNASMLLKQYIDANFSNLNVLLVGDLNDILTDVTDHNVFQSILNDSENYKFVDTDIATGNATDWSFPNWPSHLDHIIITNELFDEFENTDTVIETIKLENYVAGGWNTYDSDITDHRPVGFKFTQNSVLGVDEARFKTIDFTNYPNPFKATTTFDFKVSDGKKKLEIYDILGRKVFSKKMDRNATTSSWNAESFPSGIYIAKLLLNKITVATLKVVVQGN